MNCWAAPANRQKWSKCFSVFKSLSGKGIELCAGFSMFVGVYAKMVFPQGGDFCKCWPALVFRSKLRAWDFSGFGSVQRFQNSGQWAVVSGQWAVVSGQWSVGRRLGQEGTSSSVTRGNGKGGKGE